MTNENNMTNETKETVRPSADILINGKTWEEHTEEAIERAQAENKQPNKDRFRAKFVLDGVVTSKAGERYFKLLITEAKGKKLAKPVDIITRFTVSTSIELSTFLSDGLYASAKDYALLPEVLGMKGKEFEGIFKRYTKQDGSIDFAFLQVAVPEAKQPFMVSLMKRFEPQLMIEIKERNKFFEQKRKAAKADLCDALDDNEPAEAEGNEPTEAEADQTGEDDADQTGEEVAV